MTKLRRFTASRVRSFGHALEGWWYVMRTQRNAWLHAGIALAIFGVCFWLQLDALRWAIIVLTTAMVFAAEFFNTAVEVIVDLASPNRHPLAKLGKDIAAASVLLTALAAVVVGILVLGPALLERFQPIFVR